MFFGKKKVVEEKEEVEEDQSIKQVLAFPDKSGKFEYKLDHDEASSSKLDGVTSMKSDTGVSKKYKSSKPKPTPASEKSEQKESTMPSKVNDVESGAKSWPKKLRAKILSTLDQPLQIEQGSKFLSEHSWPEGLKQTVFKSCKKIVMRFFIVDDSGSMVTNDGQRIVQNDGVYKVVKCSRWSELSECCNFLANLSESLRAPSEFRLLNGADPIITGIGDDSGDTIAFLREVLNDPPAGKTPLCSHINCIVAEISSIADTLRANKQKVAVIICTDGESSDGNVASALKPLTYLPVLVILRLCTSEDKVVDYWNNIDSQLELDIDVLDDQLGDASEVARTNKWLTYGEPLHRVREFGASMKELDIIDESALSSEQMRVICGYLFLGGNVDQLPHPGADWNVFFNKIKLLCAREPEVFCPTEKKLRPWVNLMELQKAYGLVEAKSSKSCSLM